MLGYGGGDGCGTSWFMMLDPDPSPPFYISGHCHSYDFWAAYYKQPIGDWYHLVITTSPDGTTFFVNGENVVSHPDFVNNTAVLLGRDLTIGVDVSYQGYGPYTDSNVGYFDGKIDELRIYNRALSQKDVQDLYHQIRHDLTIHPKVGGDTGSVSVRIDGASFTDDMTVRLQKDGQPDIHGTSVSIQDGGTTLKATFDLSGKMRGLWDVVILRPDGSFATLPGGFTLEEGKSPKLWMDIVGLNVFRFFRPQVYHIIYGNSGNVDCSLANVLLRGIPKDATIRTDFGYKIDQLSETRGTQSPKSYVYETDDEKMIPIQLFNVPAGYTGILNIENIGK